MQHEGDGRPTSGRGSKRRGATGGEDGPRHDGGPIDRGRSHYPGHSSPTDPPPSAASHLRHYGESSSAAQMGRTGYNDSPPRLPRTSGADSLSASGGALPNAQFADQAYFRGASALSSSSSSVLEVGGGNYTTNGHHGLNRSRDTPLPAMHHYEHQALPHRHNMPQQLYHHTFLAQQGYSSGSGGTQLGQMAYASRPQDSMESVIDVSNRSQLLQEKKEMNGARSAPPKPQSPVILQWYAFVITTRRCSAARHFWILFLLHKFSFSAKRRHEID